MHQTIKRFGMDGEIADDAGFIRLRIQQENLILRAMREEGYIPVIGFGPFFSTRWDDKKKSYKFKLSIYGIKVGKERACEIEGVDLDGNFHQRPTRQAKSKPSSDPVE